MLSSELVPGAGGHSRSSARDSVCPDWIVAPSLRPCHSLWVKLGGWVVGAVWSEMRPGLGSWRGQWVVVTAMSGGAFAASRRDSLAHSGHRFGSETIWVQIPGPPLALGLTFSSFPGLSPPRLLIHDVLVLGASHSPCSGAWACLPSCVPPAGALT